MAINYIAASCCVCLSFVKSYNIQSRKEILAQAVLLVLCKTLFFHVRIVGVNGEHGVYFHVGFNKCSFAYFFSCYYLLQTRCSPQMNICPFDSVNHSSPSYKSCLTIKCRYQTFWFIAYASTKTWISNSVYNFWEHRAYSKHNGQLLCSDVFSWKVIVSLL